MTLTSSMPNSIGTVQEADHAHVVEQRQPRHHHVVLGVELGALAPWRVMLASRLPWVIRTAFGSAVDPLVSCSSAVASSSTSTWSSSGSPAASSSSQCGRRCRARRAPGRARRTARRAAPASSRSCSARARCPRPTRRGRCAAVGWCSIVTLPPASHTACTAGRDRGRVAGEHRDRALLAAPPSRAPGHPPAPVRAPRPRSGGPGTLGSPVVIPLSRPLVAVASIVSTNALMKGSLERRARHSCS